MPQPVDPPITPPETWAIVELMGHVSMAGRITKPGEFGGLWQIDIPLGDTFTTEFFGNAAVYRVRIVSEEIARAYAPAHEILEYNAPILTRAEHERVVNNLQQSLLRAHSELNRRTLSAGPGQECLDDDDDGDPDEKFAPPF